MDIDGEHLGIPDQDYNATIKMVSINQSINHHHHHHSQQQNHHHNNHESLRVLYFIFISFSVIQSLTSFPIKFIIIILILIVFFSLPLSSSAFAVIWLWSEIPSSSASKRKKFVSVLRENLVRETSPSSNRAMLMPSPRNVYQSNSRFVTLFFPLNHLDSFDFIWISFGFHRSLFPWLLHCVIWTTSPKQHHFPQVCNCSWVLMFLLLCNIALRIWGTSDTTSLLRLRTTLEILTILTKKIIHKTVLNFLTNNNNNLNMRLIVFYSSWS